ncbi:helix-turn-helix domain-containing protein [Lederbergia panacisoli]|uniref:helix-turn-helix domain-containing protein n=1 Tax=Lederbergia panacisoli TaxID=1255251 RepID=UPI00214C1109|nr:helix-turn-helix domain-containing protein [Lederbergia panacisoli]MCR2820071.1 AraC family transcriptional regulator [Lederbergia panacisoli]
MKKNSNYRLLLSYILSYLLIFIVPFSIISMIFYYNSVKSLREETELSNINNLNNIKNMIDGRMKELNDIGALISIDWKLTPYRVSRNEFRPDATTELEKYKQNSSIIDDLYLYYFIQNNIYSGNGQMSMDAFLKFRTNLENTTTELFVSNLKNIDYPGISTDIKPFGSNPTFVYPLPPGSVGTYGVIFMKLENTFFENMINNILGGYEGNVFIYDHNDQPVSTFSNDSTIFNPSVIDKILGNDSRIQEMKIENINYSIVKVKSEVSDWSYMMALPTNQFFSKVSKFKTFMLLVFLFIAIVTSAITIYIALKNFHPIQKMVDIVKRKETSIEFNSKNDLENLSVLLENLYIKHDDLNNKYIRQKPLIRDQYLTTLLKGQMKTINKSNELFDSIQLNLDGSHSFVMVTALTKNQLSRLDMEKLEEAAGQLLKSAKIYGVELINDKIIAYIINGKFNSKSEKNMFLTQFKQLLTNDSSMFIGVGKTYTGKNFINRSFIEASAAFEYGKTNQISNIVHFDEIKEHQETDTIWLPKSHLLKLTQSCKQGNIEIADEAVDSLIIWLQNHVGPNHLLKHLKYDLVNTLIKIASETGISLNPSAIYYQYDDTNLQQFQKILSDLTKEICNKIAEKKESQKNQLQLDILEYINTHFQDYNLSLENIAKDFNLSASYLSRFIKEETTKTFSQYVWELRLGEVKRQLIETDLPIKNIISSVGYIDAPNFTRKFKKTLGLTPSEYRNVHAKNWVKDPEKSF